ncbi:MAG: NAD(P)-dependent oxidoreductase [Planctomycetaceae bacterium]
MKRVVVTGAGGFVGRHCCAELLANGFEVHGIYSLQSVSLPQRDSAVIPHSLDLFDLPGVEQRLQQIRATHLLHLAWIATPGEFWTSSQNLDWAAASSQLVHSFCDAGGQRVVATGSCAEYDWQSGVCSEIDTPIRPASVYGTAKHVFHEHLEDYARQVGVSAAWARLFFLYGPHGSSRRLPGAIIEPLWQGKQAPCSTGELQRDYVYITDAAAAICRLLDSDVVGAVNIASGKPVRLRDMIQMCAQEIGREDLVAWGAIPSGNEAPLVVGDSRRLRDELGWSPRVSLADGLRMTVEWWRTPRGVLRDAA